MVNKAQTILVVAPHPDDETYGCGGTLLRHRDAGDSVHWLIVTKMSETCGFSQQKMITRDQEIAQVAKMYEFNSVHRLDFSPAQLDQISMQELVTAIGKIFHLLQPQIVYLPYRDDVHTDHRIVFDGAVACTKWFRYPSIKKVLAYETLSETHFNLNPTFSAFSPNSYTNIGKQLEKKITIAKKYVSEYGDFPFPRSEQAIRALAHYRGSLAGFEAAEAFIMLKEVHE